MEYFIMDYNFFHLIYQNMCNHENFIKICDHGIFYQNTIIYKENQYIYTHKI